VVGRIGRRSSVCVFHGEAGVLGECGWGRHVGCWACVCDGVGGESRVKRRSGSEHHVRDMVSDLVECEDFLGENT
jgi:hypothetical protein